MDKSHGQEKQASLVHPLDEILAGIAEGFIAFDNDWRFTYVNAAAAPAGGVGERVLVVEDNPDVRRVVLAQLEGLGYRTFEADNAEAALALLNRGEAVDLLFTDIIMPGQMNGAELAHAARAGRDSR